jgi:TRAP-type C4-dicarboxylate transport system permease small subunit
VIRRALGNIVEGVLLVMMVALCADVFLGVFSRYVLVRTFTWYDEIARLLFVWIVFLGPRWASSAACTSASISSSTAFPPGSSG